MRLIHTPALATSLGHGHAPLVAFARCCVEAHRLALTSCTLAELAEHRDALRCVGEHADFAWRNYKPDTVEYNLFFVTAPTARNLGLVSAREASTTLSCLQNAGLSVVGGMRMPVSRIMPGGKHPVHWFLLRLLLPFRASSGMVQHQRGVLRHDEAVQWVVLPELIFTALHGICTDAQHAAA